MARRRTQAARVMRSIPDYLMIETAPPCPRCEGRMDFQRIDPGIRGFVNRVYECGRCYTMKTVQSVEKTPPLSRKYN
jgi:hypothetical protein